MKSQPQYLEIRKTILDRIRSGEYSIGSRLPARVVLMREFGVTRVTIDRALGALLAEGVLTSRRRGGTTVANGGPIIRAAIMTRFLPRSGPVKPASDNFYALFQGLFESGSGINWEIISPDMLAYRRKEHEKYDVIVAVRPRTGVLEKLRIPRSKLIVINRYFDDCRCASTDHYGVARRMTGALLEHFGSEGHFYLDDPRTEDFVVGERRRGFIDACEAKDRFYRVLNDRSLPGKPASGVVVIFCSYLGRADEIVREYAAAGWEFGRDFFCCDFDNFSDSPPVPTAIQDYARMGQAAVRMILDPVHEPNCRFCEPEFRHFEAHGIHIG